MSGTFFATPAIIILAFFAYCIGFFKVDLFGSQARQKNTTSVAFDKVWPEVKSKLCPRMKPNVKYGRQLFLAAQGELGMIPVEDSGELSELERFIGIERYWTFQSGGWLYTPKDGNASTIYMRIFKGGNNQIMQGFGSLILSASESEGHYTVFSNLSDVPRQILNHACIVTVVRDPVERWLSGYNEIEYRAAKVHPRQMNRNQKSQFHRFRNATEERFEQFVRDFIGGPSRDLQIQYGHIYSMSGIIHHLNEDVGAQLTSYLPSLADLGHTFPSFLTSTCPNMPKSAHNPMSRHGQHATSDDPLGSYSAAKQVWKKQGITARALCAISAMDYACYEKLPIPSLCQEVFADDSFLRILDKNEDVAD